MDLPEGYSLKAPQLEDVPAIAAALIASDVDAYGTPDSDENDVKDDWAYEGFDPTTDAWVVVRPDGGAAGYAGVFKKKPGEVLEAYGTVHPEDRGRGIGFALMRLVEQRAETYLHEVGADEIDLQQHIIGVDEAAAELFASGGYRVIRHTWRMAIDLAGELREFPCPDGIEVRTFRPGEEQAVHTLNQEAFADHWQYNPQSYEVWLRRTVGSDAFDPELWLLATHGDRLVGESLSYIYSGQGYVDSLSVLPEFRGRGVAAQLLSRSFALFKDRGLSTVALHVDAQNPTGATRLYERVGMHIDRVYDLYGRKVTRS